MKISHIFKIMTLIILFCFILYFLPYNNANSTNTLAQPKMISNQKGDFLLPKLDDNIFSIYKLDNKGNITKVDSEPFSVKSYFFANEKLFLICRHSKNLPIVKINNDGASSDVGSIADTQLKTNCITASTYDYIFLTDEREQQTVLKYQLDGTLYNTYHTGKNIYSLFAENSNNNVFAITDGGIIAVERNSFISCITPSEPYTFYGNYCCDNDGNVFSFNSTKGFNLIMKTDCKNVCVINNTVYGAKNNTIYKFDSEGNKTHKYELNSKIQQLCASKSSLAVMCNNNPQIIDKNCFTKINTENYHSQSSSESSKHNPEASQPYHQNSKPSQQSHQNNQSSFLNSENQNLSNISSQNEFSITSNKYKFYEDIITNIPQGTTIRQFKNNIHHNADNITFTNHNSKVKTSGQLGTGWCVSFSINGKIIQYYTVIQGDITGEGNINSRDINLFAEYLLEKSDLSKYQLYASDLNSDGIYNSLDLLLLKKITE